MKPNDIDIAGLRDAVMHSKERGFDSVEIIHDLVELERFLALAEIGQAAVEEMEIDRKIGTTNGDEWERLNLRRVELSRLRHFWCHRYLARKDG